MSNAITRAMSLAVVAALAIAVGVPATAQSVPPPPRPLAAPAETADAELPETAPVPDPAVAADLFAMPRIADESRIAIARLQGGDIEGAAAAFDRLITRHPSVPALHLNRAGLHMLAGEPNEAVAELITAVELGLPDLRATLADPLFLTIRADARLENLPDLPVPAPPAPTEVAEGQAPVSAANTRWSSETERLVPAFAFPGSPANNAVLPDQPRRGAHDLLRDHWRRGRAAGNHGDLYDNRDRGHSTLRADAHPQLTHVSYSDAARRASIDYGLNDTVLFDRPTLGNSSTAMTRGPQWRSLPRLALTRADGTGPMRLWQNADNNHLYVHPAHRDFDEERGDLFPANTPYLIVSRGSSGSDRPFLEAMAMALAAFRPDTKARLTETRMIVPTLQWVFRRSQQHIQSRDAYFSGAAHPAVFEGFRINAARMVSLANSIQPGDIPAQVRLRVLGEDTGTEGVNFFGGGLSEQLFDTPGAIARVWRSTAGRRSMTVSADNSRDVNDRPLTFQWHLLQGDPDKVRIEPAEDGISARITIDWHEPFRISEETPVTASRVDIGVFANNGVHDSAPAIVSVYFPPHEERVYEDGPDGAPRIVSIDRAGRPDVYTDPLFVPRADWRDDYHYAEDGTLVGWTRTRPGRDAEDFAADGSRILTRGDDETPLRGEIVAYGLKNDDDGVLVVEELSTGQLVDYQP